MDDYGPELPEDVWRKLYEAGPVQPTPVTPLSPTLSELKERAFTPEMVTAPPPQETAPPAAPPQEGGFLSILKGMRDSPEKLDALRNISEGMQGFGRGIERGAMIRGGMNPNLAEPAVAGGIRNRLAELYETAQHQRDITMKLGLMGAQQDFTAGENAKDRESEELRTRMTAESHMAGAQARPPSAAILQLLQSKGVEGKEMTAQDAMGMLGILMRDEREKGIQDRFEKMYPLREESSRRLPTEAADKIADLTLSLKKIDRVRKEFKANPSVVGPISGRYNQLVKKIGAGDPDADVFLANVDDMVFTNLYQLSGKQINEAERTDLKQTVFDAAKNGKSFEALLNNYEERVRDVITTKLEAYGATGRDVSGFKIPGRKVSAIVNGQEVWGTQEAIDAYKAALQSQGVK